MKDTYVWDLVSVALHCGDNIDWMSQLSTHKMPHTHIQSHA